MTAESTPVLAVKPLAATCVHVPMLLYSGRQYQMSVGQGFVAVAPPSLQETHISTLLSLITERLTHRRVSRARWLHGQFSVPTAQFVSMSTSLEIIMS